MIASFQDRASFNPAATSDSIFETAAGIDAAAEGIDEAAYLEEGNNSDWEHADRRSSTKKKKKKKKKGGSVLSASSLDQTMVTYIGKLSSKIDEGKNDVEKKVELAGQFKSMSDSLGGRIKAAYQMPAFRVFLDRDEKRELKRYAAVQEAPSDDEGLVTNSSNNT